MQGTARQAVYLQPPMSKSFFLSLQTPITIQILLTLQCGCGGDCLRDASSSLQTYYNVSLRHVHIRRQGFCRDFELEYLWMQQTELCDAYCCCSKHVPSVASQKLSDMTVGVEVCRHCSHNVISRCKCDNLTGNKTAMGVRHSH